MLRARELQPGPQPFRCQALDPPTLDQLEHPAIAAAGWSAAEPVRVAPFAGVLNL